MDLLGIEDPEAVDVLLVTVTKSARERLDALKRHADAPPANVGVVSVQVGGTSGTARVGGEDGPAVRRISDPSDLTGVGIAIAEFLSVWADTGNRTVVCVESLTALLQYVDASRVFQFCNELTSKFERAEALAHFHITPDAHEPQVWNVLSSLFDSRVGAADLGYGPQGEGSTSASAATTGPDRLGEASDELDGEADDPFEYVAEDSDSDQGGTGGEPTDSETGRKSAAEPPESADTEENDEAVEEIDLVDPRDSGSDDDEGVATDDQDDGPSIDASDAESPGAGNEADASDVHDTPTASEQSAGNDARETGTGVDASEPGPSNEPGDRPVKYALYQRTTATVVGVVVMLVLLSFLAAAMPLPIGTDGPGNGGADVPTTATPTSDAAAAADADDDQGATATGTSTAEPTATPTATAEPTPTPTATPTATETPTPSPTPTAEPTATPEPTPSATEEDGSLTDEISDTLDGDEEEDDDSLL